MILRTQPTQSEVKTSLTLRALTTKEATVKACDVCTEFGPIDARIVAAREGSRSQVVNLCAQCAENADIDLQGFLQQTYPIIESRFGDQYTVAEPPKHLPLRVIDEQEVEGW